MRWLFCRTETKEEPGTEDSRSDQKNPVRFAAVSGSAPGCPEKQEEQEDNYVITIRIISNNLYIC